LAVVQHVSEQIMKGRLTVSAAMLLLGACNSEVQVPGDVFVASRGGQSFKLALVEISAFAEADIRDAAVRHARRADSVLAGQPDIRELQARVADANARLVALADAPGSTAAAAIWRDSFLYEAPPRVGDKSRWSAFRRAYTDSIVAEKNLANAGRTAAALTGSVFDSLPSPSATAKTDADGRFTITLKRGQRYLIRATASRDVIGSTENYEWLVWRTAGAGTERLVLANDNMTDTEPGEAARAEIQKWVFAASKRR
jgi:hypothetical protein